MSKIDKIRKLLDDFNELNSQLVEVDRILSLITERTEPDGDITVKIDNTTVKVPANGIKNKLEQRKKNIEDDIALIEVKFDV